jgi:hemolysin activation/secretion protein
LLAFEEYSAGDYTIGRGYDPASITGDKGVGVQAELRYGSLIPAGRKSLRIQPFVFVDAAWVRNQDRIFTVAGRNRLASAGGGLRMAFGDQARLDMIFAAPLARAGLQTKRPDPRFLVTFTTRLLPWRVR